MFKKINLVALLIGILFSSCSNKFSLIKRRYHKGYHLEIAGKHKTESSRSSDGKIAAHHRGHEKPVVIQPEPALVTAETPALPEPLIVASAGGVEKPALTGKKEAKASVLKHTKTTDESGNDIGFPAKNRRFVGSKAGSKMPGTMMSGDLMYGVAYGLGSVVVMIFFYILFYAILYGLFANPEMLLAVLAIIVIAALIVGVLFIINSD
jgi:hypothetical protein